MPHRNDKFGGKQIARRHWALHGQYVAGPDVVVKMRLDLAIVELMHDLFDPPFDGGIVGAITSDEFLDNRPQPTVHLFRIQNLP